MQWDRREFVFSLAALALAPPRRLLGSSNRNMQESAPALTPVEKELLGHICEQIVPTDEFPGARELGVVEFIDRVLKEAHPEWLEVYRAGLRSTDLTSRELHERSFSELTPDQQIELLQRMERTDLPPASWSAPAQSDFFSMVRSHTFQGYYSHPTWGGNRDKVSWKMIGYDDWWT